MIDVDKIQFSSSIGIDKIVLLKTGSFDTASQPTVTVGMHKYTIPHSFGRPVFTELLWNMGNGFTDGGNSLDVNNNQAISLSDKDNVYIYCQNITGAISGTLEYKLIGSWMDNYDASDPLITPEIDTTGGTFFDSRSNYQKLYLDDYSTYASPVGGASYSINHNLGYLPNYKVFFESLPGQIWPAIYGGTQDFWLYDLAHQNELEPIVTTAQLTFTLAGGVSSANARVWYRIYYDH